MKIFLSMLLVLYFSGCASRGVTEVDANALNYELNYEIGTIEYMKPVVVKDNGNGTFIGAISGVVLGSMVGRGNGNALATLVGGLGGAYVGNEINKANALELGVVLDSGRRVVVITKGKNFSNGERVRIVKRNGRIYSVEAL